jgi:hypothetical protein
VLRFPPLPLSHPSNLPGPLPFPTPQLMVTATIVKQSFELLDGAGAIISDVRRGPTESQRPLQLP